MKAKTYYANRLALDAKRPTPCGLNILEGHGDVSVRVIKSSDIPKLVERAARDLYIADNGPRSAARWTAYLANSPVTKGYLMRARAAFKSIGLL